MMDWSRRRGGWIAADPCVVRLMGRERHARGSEKARKVLIAEIGGGSRADGSRCNV